MRTETRTIYEPSDYERYRNNMTATEAADVLNQIDDGWIGHSNYYGQENYEGDERDFELFRMHQALLYAIRSLRHQDKVVEQLKSKSLCAREEDEPFIMLDEAIEIVKGGGRGAES